MPDYQFGVEALLVQAMDEDRAGEPDNQKKSAVGWFRQKLGLSSRKEAPDYVRDTFQRIFELAREALGARGEDFMLGNVNLRRNHEGISLDYRWREDREESVTCSRAGKYLSLTWDSFMKSSFNPAFTQQVQAALKKSADDLS